MIAPIYSDSELQLMVYGKERGGTCRGTGAGRIETPAFLFMFPQPLFINKAHEGKRSCLLPKCLAGIGSEIPWFPLLQSRVSPTPATTISPQTNIFKIILVKATAFVFECSILAWGLICCPTRANGPDNLQSSLRCHLTSPLSLRNMSAFCFYSSGPPTLSHWFPRTKGTY